MNSSESLIRRMRNALGYVINVFTETCDCGKCGPCRKIRHFEKLRAEAAAALKPPPDPYAHLSQQQKEKIWAVAIEYLEADILGDKDNPRFWAEYIIKDWGIDQCLEQISDDPQKQARTIGFDPDTGKEVKDE